MSSITQEQRERGFELSLAFYKDEISFGNAVEQLTRSGMGKGSAQDYVRYIKEYMSVGHTPTRTMSISTQSLFLKGVLEYLGEKKLQQWAVNDRKHFDYYEEISGATVVGRRKNLEKFLETNLNNKNIVLEENQSEEVDIYLFHQYFKQFKNFVEKKSGMVFTNFVSNSYTEDQEGYKNQLFLDARSNLNFGEWSKSDIGSGKILQSVILAIEIKENNLLDWGTRYGEEQRPHHKLHVATSSNTQIYEEYFYNFFNSLESDESFFNWLISEFGQKYSFIAYLFFIKDKSKYMPIKPSIYDEVFKDLNIDFKTSGLASWTNYKHYNSLINKIKDLLESELKNDVQLLEAHSFLWIIARQMKSEGIVLDNQVKYIEAPAMYKEAVVKSRIGQGQFRNDLIAYWHGCTVTGVKQKDMLIASHIKPWKDCEDSFEAIDKFNGLLLIPTLDKAFDQGYISFSDEGNILISDELTYAKALGINDSMQINGLRAEHTMYLKYHREMIFKD